jgi:hypothetical protein
VIGELFGTKAIATRLVTRAREISAQFKTAASANKDQISASGQLAVATTLEVLAGLVQEIFVDG